MPTPYISIELSSYSTTDNHVPYTGSYGTGDFYLREGLAQVNTVDLITSLCATNGFRKNAYNGGSCFIPLTTQWNAISGLNSSWTISVWIKKPIGSYVNQGVACGCFTEEVGVQTRSTYMGFNTETSFICYTYLGDDVNQFELTTGIKTVDFNWHHWVFKRDCNYYISSTRYTRFACFCDGYLVSDGTQLWNATPNPAQIAGFYNGTSYNSGFNLMSLGVDTDTGNNFSNPFVGKMCLFKMYNVSLTDIEVLALYNSEKAVSEDISFSNKHEV
jgi:hypothetical protein